MYKTDKNFFNYRHYSFTIMDSIMPDIVRGIEIWLGPFHEQNYNKLNRLCERIQQTLLMMRYEAQLTQQSQYTLTLWLEVFQFLTDNSIATKTEITWKILLLREFGEISTDVEYYMITKLLT